MQFTIIVPIYNAEKHLRKCLESIQNQTYKGDYEVILIDDGSTDGSSSICDEYSKKDPRFKTVHKPNGGLVKARKTALDYISGEYVISVDSDDWIDEEYLESISRRINEYHPDLLSWGYTQVDINGRVIKDEHNVCENGFYKDDSLDRIKRSFFFDERKGGINGGCLIYSIWSKAVKSEIYIRNQKKVDNRIGWGEDATLVLFILQEVKSLLVFDLHGYMFRANLQSMTHAPDNKEIYRASVVIRTMLRHLDDRQISRNQIYAHASNFLFLLVYRYAVNDFKNYLGIAKMINKAPICDYACRASIKSNNLSDAVKIYLTKKRHWLVLGFLCVCNNGIHNLTGKR